MQVKSYTDLKALIQALAGVSSFTTEEDSKILSFVNRRAAEAYNVSPSWARYLVVSEERTITTANTIPYTQSPKDDIGEFIRIHRKQAFLNNSSLEYDFYVDSSGANILLPRVICIAPFSTVMPLTYKPMSLLAGGRPAAELSFGNNPFTL